ncbi:MAG: hypothetical protein V3W37_08605 [Candidatus Binatia bacterium]
MRKAAFYNEGVGAKADQDRNYSILNNQGLDPGAVPLPVSKWESSTAARVKERKKRKGQIMAKKAALLQGFSEEMQKLGFNGGMIGLGGRGRMAGGMAGRMGAGGPGTRMGRMGLGRGGVVTSKSKKSLGPRIRIVSSKSKRRY